MGLKVVSKRYTGKPGVTSFILRMVGAKGDGPWAYTFSDGYEFQPYPMSDLVTDWSMILRGCSDVTGERFMKYQQALGRDRPALNSLELKYTTFTAVAGAPELDRIRKYDGPLNTDPALWPEPYRSAWAEGHRD